MTYIISEFSNELDEKHKLFKEYKFLSNNEYSEIKRVKREKQELDMLYKNIRVQLLNDMWIMDDLLSIRNNGY